MASVPEGNRFLASDGAVAAGAVGADAELAVGLTAVDKARSTGVAGAGL